MPGLRSALQAIVNDQVMVTNMALSGSGRETIWDHEDMFRDVSASNKLAIEVWGIPRESWVGQGQCGHTTYSPHRPAAAGGQGQGGHRNCKPGEAQATGCDQDTAVCSQGRE